MSPPSGHLSGTGAAEVVGVVVVGVRVVTTVVGAEVCGGRPQRRS